MAGLHGLDRLFGVGPDRLFYQSRFFVMKPMVTVLLASSRRDTLFAEPNHALQPTAGAGGVPAEFHACTRPAGG